MFSIIRLILGFTILCGLIALSLSIWPGVLAELLFISILLSVIWVPLAIVATVVLSKMQWRQSSASFAEVMAIPCVAILTIALLVFTVPRRIVFLGCRSAFEAAVVSTPMSEQGVRFGERLGIYRVDERAIDPRGGAFFRVFAGSDNIGPDTMSYGFVKKPNPKGTPFGAAHYAIFHLVDDWYCFRASNDSY